MVVLPVYSLRRFSQTPPVLFSLLECAFRGMQIGGTTGSVSKSGHRTGKMTVTGPNWHRS